jgi:hypothetical protein
MFQPNHHSSEKQAARANKRYQKKRANGTTLVVDEIANSGLSRSAFCRLKKKTASESIEPIEKIIADGVAADYPNVTEPTPVEGPSGVDEEDFEFAYRRLNISPRRAYEWRQEGKLKLRNGLWTYQP